MTRDEPLAIAERLAARLVVPFARWPEQLATAGGVLLVAGTLLDDVPDEQLADAAALLVTGGPSDASSSGLIALGERVTARQLTLAASTFATTAGPDGAPAELPLVVAEPAGQTRVAGLVAAGPHALTLDAAVDIAAVAEGDQPARVCIVSFEVSGMTGGGIGTASTSLAETLARAGHDVTLLFTGWQERDDGEQNARWQRHYAEREVRLEILRRPGQHTVGNPHFAARAAYEVYCWLSREAPFDVVHVPDNMGLGTYAQLAKRQGRRFAETTFVVGTHGPLRWAAEANRVALTREEFLVNEALERTSVALADVLLGPSRYLHDYMRQRGWTLPARVHVQPYALPTAVRTGDAADIPAVVRARVHGDADVERGAGAGLPDEIVFFGRLETRKGVITLCDALDRLSDGDDLPRFSVTFLGPVAEVLGQPADAYIAGRAKRWPWRWQIVSDRDQQGAADYLSRPGVLAVMPSTVDNAPNTVSEAIALGIPLVAGRTGGTGELVAAEQRDDHMFGPPPGEPLLPLPLSRTPAPVDAAPLADLLHRRLTTRVEPARAAGPSDAVDAAYDRWHRAVRRANDVRTAAPAVSEANAGRTTLAVCLLFDGDEQLLRAQLDALTADASENELVVADLRADPSEPVATAAARDVTVVRPDRPGHHADARTAAIAATSGELIAFVPPGDIPLTPFAVALSAAAITGAAAYACVVLDELPAEDDEEDELIGGHERSDDATVHAFVPVGGPSLAGLTHPAFSPGPYAVRREALAQLSGFAPDAHGDEADHELLNRLSTAGLRIEVVPEPLATKHRPDRWSTFRSVWKPAEATPPYDAEQWLRVERPFTQAGEATSDLVGVLRGTRADAGWFRGLMEEQQRVYEDRSAEQRKWIDDVEQKAVEYRQYQDELVAEVTRLQAEVAQLRTLNEEMSQSAAQLAARSLRAAGRRVAGRATRPLK